MTPSDHGSPIAAAGTALGEPRETSGVTTGLVLRFVRQRGGPDAVDELLRRAGVAATESELVEVSRWVSYETRIRLFSAAVEVLDDPSCTHEMGATSLLNGLNSSLVLLLRGLGSPTTVYRQLPRAVPKFTTTSTMEVLRAGRGYATLRYVLHEGYEHSRLDCAYAQGLISVVPELFGLPRARIRHDECQSDGHDACVYVVSWLDIGSGLFRWLGRRSSRPTPELLALRGQLEELQSAAVELVRNDDLTALLDRIVERAAAAVLSPAYLLVVQDPEGKAPLVHSRGIGESERSDLARRLLAGEDMGPGAVVVDVASTRRQYGRLAALYTAGHQGPVDEDRLLRAYAGHAAAALDLVTALGSSRRGEARTGALLALANDLRGAVDSATVARVVAEAVPTIMGSDSAAVHLWDARDGCLRATASTGLLPAEVGPVTARTLLPHDTPELASVLTRLEPAILRPAEITTPHLRDLLQGWSDVVAMPMVAEGRLLAVATAGWRAENAVGDVDEVLARFRGVAEYAATALQNVHLLATVRHQADHDHLTGLPNRSLFGRELDRAARSSHRPDALAVLFCDLDRFKEVNDLLGHAAGDQLLCQAVERMARAVRAEDLVARLSGDEFAVLLRGLDDAAVATAIADRIVAELARPFHVDGLDVHVTASVGVALHHPGTDPEALLQAADGAMYAAKERGRNQVAHAGPTSPGTTGPG